ncbi:MAG: hypothetical protein ACRDJC_24115, partial [Thermomicrobiales bacterium]
MNPLDIAQAVPVTTAEDFDRFLRDHGAAEREVIAAIFKRAFGKQTVTLAELQERAIVFVTGIPRTATGKPLRGELAAAVAAMLAPASAASMSSSRSENPNDLTAKVAEIWAG